MRQWTIEPACWGRAATKLPGFLREVSARLPEFRAQEARAAEENRDRLAHARSFDLPAVSSLRIDVYLEYYASSGFCGDCGVSYGLTTECGSVLFDIGFGEERRGVVPNMRKMGFDLSSVDGIVISHNHWDHMGGSENVAKGRIVLPEGAGKVPDGLPVWVASPVRGDGLQVICADRPMELAAGVCSLGTLSRAMFWVGYCTEQVVVVNIRGKGLVLVSGCAHPTIPLMLSLVKRVSDVPIWAIVGGLHLPVTQSRITRDGVRLNFVMGSGMVPWRRPSRRDVERTLDVLEQEGVQRFLLSAHDTCDYTLDRFAKRFPGRVEVLRAGKSYTL